MSEADIMFMAIFAGAGSLPGSGKGLPGGTDHLRDFRTNTTPELFSENRKATNAKGTGP
ncbi:MAG TPA: hypothetical protein VGK74_07285 [Symbiobacteriaceae bacterium]